MSTPSCGFLSYFLYHSPIDIHELECCHILVTVNSFTMDIGYRCPEHVVKQNIDFIISVSSYSKSHTHYSSLGNSVHSCNPPPLEMVPETTREGFSEEEWLPDRI